MQLGSNHLLKKASANWQKKALVHKKEELLKNAGNYY